MDKNNNDGKSRIEFVEGVHYYLEGGKVVFTEEYHIRRGSCCGSGKGCRHCPYDPVGVRGNTVLSKKPE